MEKNVVMEILVVIQLKEVFFVVLSLMEFVVLIKFIFIIFIIFFLWLDLKKFFSKKRKIVALKHIHVMLYLVFVKGDHQIFLTSNSM